MFICSFSDKFYRKEWGFFIFLCLRDKGYLFISLKHGECMRKLVVFVMLMTCVISAQAAMESDAGSRYERDKV